MDSWGEEKHEECGVAGIASKKGDKIAPLLYRSMMALQHRGQDAAGLTVFNGKLETRKGLGFVNDIFKPEDMEVGGSIGIGHTRYPTSGRITIAEVQPFIYQNIAIAHNGHIANGDSLREELKEQGFEFSSTADSEVLAMLIAQKKGILNGVRNLMDKVDGAFSITALVDGKLVAFRDKHAIRPMVYGENEEYVAFASESVALDVNDIPYQGEIRGGEVVVWDGKLVRSRLQEGTVRHCMFEYVYFARPDSIQNGVPVFEVRKRLGEQLAREHPVEADVVIPVPDTSRTAAEVFARAVGIPLEEGLIKNRYIARTFIMSTPEKRRDAVRVKLNPIRKVIEGKRIVLIDDSIVRGTTLREIVKLVRGAGAREVHVRITCPPLRAPCFYGIDMKTYDELIAHNKSIPQIEKFLGVDSLGYLSIDGLKRAIGLPVCTGCLNEEYVTPVAKKLAKAKKDEKLGCG